MKKLFVLLSFVSFSGVFAQEVPTTTPEKTVPVTTTTTTTTTTISTETNRPTLFTQKNEVRIGIINLYLLNFELSYEHIQSKSFGYGATISINAASANASAKRNENFELTPFARVYFQETKEYGAKGFFVEGFGKFSQGKFDGYNKTTNSYNSDYSAFALGFAGGKKWISSSGFVFETLIGLGRTLANGDQTKPDVLFRGDISLGYRF